MMLSGVVPWNSLPAWMYHGQTPPPSRAFNADVPGITWVDLVFPFFLFALGAAIPLALGRRVSQGDQPWRHVAVRGLLLAAFAIYVGHVRPYTLEPSPSRETWWLSILAFALAIPMWAQIPRSWPSWTPYVVRIAGWLGALALLASLRYPDGSGFQKERNDIILLVLANVAFFGGAIWLLTRANAAARLAVLLALVAWRVSATVDGSWASVAFNFGDWAWIVSPKYVIYLLLVLPGTLVGEWLADPPAPSLDAARLAMLGLLGLVAQPVALVVLHQRLPVALAAIPCALLLALAWRSEDLAARLVRFGAALFLIGLILEPFQGGIKKDPNTLSYHFVTGGLACFLLMTFMTWERVGRARGLGFVATVGQNAMLAYLAITNLVAPIWSLSIGGWVAERTQEPWAGFWLNAVPRTLLLAALVWALTKLKVVMRA